MVKTYLLGSLHVNMKFMVSYGKIYGVCMSAWNSLQNTFTSGILEWMNYQLLCSNWGSVMYLKEFTNKRMMWFFLFVYAKEECLSLVWRKGGKPVWDLVTVCLFWCFESLKLRLLCKSWYWQWFLSGVGIKCMAANPNISFGILIG